MIQVRQITPPIKLSGLSSFLVKFNYNPEIIEIIKSLDAYYWHSKEFTWEIPISSLSTLLDKLVFYDNVYLTVDNTNNTNMKLDEFQKPLTEEEIKSLKFKPYEHQIDGINFGLEKKKWLLLDMPGLGKTNQIIGLAEILHKRGVIDHCLIICGVNSLKQNWKKEIKKYSNESVIILGETFTRSGKSKYETLPKRAEQLKGKIKEFFVIVNIEALRDNRILEAFKKSQTKFGMIAVDEIHKCGSQQSQSGTNLLKLNADYKVAATGTLVTNNPESTYVALKWTENEHGILTQFRNQYCITKDVENRKLGVTYKQVTGFRNLEVLKEELDTCAIRRTKDIVKGLPEKTVTVELVEMSDAHKKFYNEIAAGVFSNADLIESKDESDSAEPNLLALSTRLRQATSCPEVLSSSCTASSKIDRCVEIVEELISQNEKVVIFSSFKATVYTLGERLKEYCPLINTGDIDDSIVSSNFDKFQNNPDYKIFIGTYDKVGTGGNLNAASYLLCVDTPYTYAMFLQGTDRIHRVNNTRPAFITVLACQDTFDQRVLRLVNTKKDLSDYIIDDVKNHFAYQNSDSVKDFDSKTLTEQLRILLWEEKNSAR